MLKKTKETKQKKLWFPVYMQTVKIFKEIFPNLCFLAKRPKPHRKSKACEDKFPTQARTKL